MVQLYSQLTVVKMLKLAVHLKFPPPLLDLAVPPPNVTITGSPVNANFFTGLQLNLTCLVQISTHKGYKVSISAQWSKSGDSILTSDSVVVEEVMEVTPLVYRTSLVFMSLDKAKGDEGNYTCSVTVTPSFPVIKRATKSASYNVVVQSKLA